MPFLHPPYSASPIAKQVVVGQAEVVAPEEPAVGRQGRGVGRCEHIVPSCRDKEYFGLRILPPEQEYDTTIPAGKGADKPIGNRLPAHTSVREALACTHC